MKSAKNSNSGRFSMILGVFAMYISSNSDQLSIEDFFMPFGGKLLKSNRWVKLASMMPWEHIEQIYMESVELERGRPATSSRIAFGAIFNKENDNLTDESTVAAIAENPYIQYFLGLTAFQAEPLFDSSMMTHFCRYPFGDTRLPFPDLSSWIINSNFQFIYRKFLKFIEIFGSLNSLWLTVV